MATDAQELSPNRCVPRCPPRPPNPALPTDCHSAAGARNLYDDDLSAAATMLAPHLAIATPNLAEAAAMTGLEVGDVREMIQAATTLSERLAASVLVTGGHLPSEVADVLCMNVQGAAKVLQGQRVELDEPVHGTGCALSTALASRLARGQELEPACVASAAYVRERLRTPSRPGRGFGAII